MLPQTSLLQTSLAVVCRGGVGDPGPAIKQHSPAVQGHSHRSCTASSPGRSTSSVTSARGSSAATCLRLAATSGAHTTLSDESLCSRWRAIAPMQTGCMHLVAALTHPRNHWATLRTPHAVKASPLALPADEVHAPGRSGTTCSQIQSITWGYSKGTAQGIQMYMSVIQA